jgi:hypothetical protein
MTHSHHSCVSYLFEIFRVASSSQHRHSPITNTRPSNHINADKNEKEGRRTKKFIIRTSSSSSSNTQILYRYRVQIQRRQIVIHIDHNNKIAHHDDYAEPLRCPLGVLATSCRRLYCSSSCSCYQRYPGKLRQDLELVESKACCR